MRLNQLFSPDADRATTSLVAAIVVTLGVTFVAAILAHVYRPGEAQFHSPLEGKPAPDLRLTGLDGKEHALCDERGHVVLIDFWGISCPPCVAELAQSTSNLAADDRLRKQGLTVWTIDVWDKPEITRSFMERHGYAFIAMADDAHHQAAIAFQTIGLPITALIGRDGVVKKVFQGFDPERTDGELRQQVAEALDER